jgi:hypothetical protein
MLWIAQRANLQLLFFISVVTTAPLWVSNFCRQSKAPPAPWALGSNSFKALMVIKESPDEVFTAESSCVRTIMLISSVSLTLRSNLRYR